MFHVFVQVLMQTLQFRDVATGNGLKQSFDGKCLIVFLRWFLFHISDSPVCRIEPLMFRNYFHKIFLEHADKSDHHIQPSCGLTLSCTNSNNPSQHFSVFVALKCIKTRLTSFGRQILLKSPLLKTYSLVKM